MKTIFAVLLFSGSGLSWCFSAPLGVLLVMKTLKDGWYVINIYKFSVFEILGRFFWSTIYCVSVLSLHRQVKDWIQKWCESHLVSFTDFRPFLLERAPL